MSIQFRSLLLILCLPLASGATEDVPTIRDYRFAWEYDSFGDVTVEVNKNQDRTFLSLRQRAGFGRYLALTADQAVAVGEALAQTESLYEKLKKVDGDLSEEVRTDDFVVLFASSPKTGFYVTVYSSDSFSMDRLMLDRREAADLAPILRRARDLVEFLDQRVNP